MAITSPLRWYKYAITSPIHKVCCLRVLHCHRPYIVCDTAAAAAAAAAAVAGPATVEPAPVVDEPAQRRKQVLFGCSVPLSTLFTSFCVVVGKQLARDIVTRAWRRVCPHLERLINTIAAQQTYFRLKLSLSVIYQVMFVCKLLTMGGICTDAHVRDAVIFHRRLMTQCLGRSRLCSALCLCSKNQLWFAYQMHWSW